MMRLKKQLPVVPVLTAAGMTLLGVFVLWTARANGPERTGNEIRALTPAVPAPAPAVVEIPLPVQKRCVLDNRRSFALGMIETGNDDREVGAAGEVSRYQIMPSVWKHYSRSSDYGHPQVSLEVAQQHWNALRDYFKAQTGREPGDFDMYVLWNTRYGYYASKGFKPALLNPVVRDRAQRFVNLVERGES